MASKFQGSEESSKGSNICVSPPKSDTDSIDSDAMLSFSVDQPNEETPQGLDSSNHSTVVDGPPDHPLGTENPSEHKIETIWFLKDFAKEKRVEKETEPDRVIVPNVDLTLELKLPGLKLQDEVSDESKSSSSTSELSCMTAEHKKDVATNAVVPTLILMACENCYMYILVSNVDPKCPKCKTNILLDVVGKFKKN